uniref:Uncharacterized protein n=1 Tax=Utricularia reniformis TaxID=192314 RepID=A0A1Y0B1W1_9LAMI|nr:hypothetical protein AEK19_MT1157 [Utricularia reniformis]ART31371.1 hypothetical protein AEK19_MT1157 [Utricularia reniformis]
MKSFLSPGRRQGMDVARLGHQLDHRFHYPGLTKYRYVLLLLYSDA